MARKKRARSVGVGVGEVERLPLTLEQTEALLAKGDEYKVGLALLALGQLARTEDSPRGFRAFYQLINGNPLPMHGLRWVREIYKAHGEGKGVLLKGFRGSWKTSIVSVCFTAWRIGKEPGRANLIIRDSDDAAERTTKAIAGIIENNAGWREVFPNIVPDNELGWGEQGYEVKRTDIGYSDWRGRNTSRQDPTLRGAGYGSSIIGGHPDGVLDVDDIHNEKNTVSKRELQGVINIVTGTLMPMVVYDKQKVGENLGRSTGEGSGARKVTWEIWEGTPWVEGDVYHYLEGTGEYVVENTPAMVAAVEEGENVFEITPADMPLVVHSDLLGKWKLLWPERFDVRALVTWRNKVGKRDFWRMFLLNLTRATETGLKYMTYPAGEIDHKWMAVAGNDYASTIELKGRRMAMEDRARFALCYMQKTPLGGAVVSGGVSGHYSQLQAEGLGVTAQGLFPNFRHISVEMNGVGEQFYGLLSRHPGIRLYPFWSGKAAKRDRQERELGPWLELGVILISDAETEFLVRLRKALDDWPNGDMDEIDALLAATKGMPEVLKMEDDVETRRPGTEKVKSENPFARIGRVGV